MEMTDYKHRIIRNSQNAFQNAQFYDERWRLEHMGISKFHRLRAGFAEACIRAHTCAKDLRILDLGCGFGWMSLFVGHYGHFWGVDYSPKAIKYARCNYNDYGEFYLADPLDVYLGLPQEQFDIVIASEVIEHVEDHQAFLAQVDLFLKSGGLIILTTPNGNLHNVFINKYGNEMQPIENWLTPDKLKDLIVSSGFEIVHQEGTLYRHPVYGLRAYLISKSLQKLMGKLGMANYYKKALLRVSIYQFLAALKAVKN